MVDHSGSTPGKTGFKMAISRSDQVGTIGGGIMELNLIEDATSYLLGEETPSKRYKRLKQIHRTSAEENEQSGLICAGEQTVIRLLLDRDYINLLSSIIKKYETLEQATLRITQNTLELAENDPDQLDYEFHDDTTDWLYQERIGLMNHVYLFGGGHVGYAISQALAPLDFYTIVHDNRPKLDMLEENKYANEIRTGDYTELAKKVKEGDQSYVIIATYGFPQDLQVLKEVISKKVKYIGLMGSSAKLNRIFQEIREAGISQKLIDKVHAPIGLDLPNETAEEIAVSVAAELIMVKNTN